ncbi:hypothetical protein ABFG93_21500 (plasmid) [Pseudalkalibacillus hwajinpoensis]|uniref:hypothetical protein n=1 Tax=Guptibacillus hwajinpoensis TaxID=208199 RepID=UPI00325AE68F
MKSSSANFDKLLGVTYRARRKGDAPLLGSSFHKPILHRQVHGDAIYVPLNLERIWNQTEKYHHKTYENE